MKNYYSHLYKHAHFNFRELSILISLALASALPWSIFTIAPPRLSNFQLYSYGMYFSASSLLSKPGIASFGGFFVIFWAALAHRIIRKKYAAIITSLFAASFVLLIDYQDYSVWSANELPWHAILGIVGFSMIGLLMESKVSSSISKTMVRGGLGSLSFFLLDGTLPPFSWAYLGTNIDYWLYPNYLVFWSLYVLRSFVLGCMGVYLASLVAKRL